MTIQTLFDAWQATEIDPSVNPITKGIPSLTSRNCSVKLKYTAIQFTVKEWGFSITTFEPMNYHVLRIGTPSFSR